MNIEVDFENLPNTSRLGYDIMSYPPNIIEQVQRAYLLKCLCQSSNHYFSKKIKGHRKYKFVQ